VDGAALVQVQAGQTFQRYLEAAAVKRGARQRGAVAGCRGQGEAAAVGPSGAGQDGLGINATRLERVGQLGAEGDGGPPA